MLSVRGRMAMLVRFSSSARSSWVVPQEGTAPNVISGRASARPRRMAMPFTAQGLTIST